MKCPTCHNSISPFKVWLITRWTPIKCNQCGTYLGRSVKDFQFWVIFALAFIPLVVLEGGLNLPFLAWMLIVMFLDAYTIKLVPKKEEER